jgi:dipeptide/tripeptide permease
MQPSRILKIALGLLTAVPAVYVVLFAVLIARMVLERASGDLTIPVPMADFMWVHLAVMVLLVGLETFYLLYLFRTDRVPPGQRAMWAVVLLVINVAAMPIFFGRYVWPERAPRSASRPAQ